MATKSKYSTPATPSYLMIPDDLVGVYGGLMALHREIDQKKLLAQLRPDDPHKEIVDEIIAQYFEAVKHQQHRNPKHLPKLPRGRTARDLSNWTYSAMEQLYAKYPTIVDGVCVENAKDILWIKTSEQSRARALAMAVVQHEPAPEGKWTRALSRTSIAQALGYDRVEKFDLYIKVMHIPIEHISKRKCMIRYDLLPKNQQEAIEKL
jgi:hypothetical protein